MKQTIPLYQVKVLKAWVRSAYGEGSNDIFDKF